MRIKFIKLLSILFIIQLFFGCMTFRLKYKIPDASSSKIGKVILIVDDRRDPDKGGNDPLAIGIARSAAGVPFTMKASSGNEPLKVMREMISSCLLASGYDVVDESNKAPVLHATLNDFWSDGYAHNRMVIKMRVELVKEIGSPPLWISFVDVNEGATAVWSVRDFGRGYNKMLETTKNKLLTDFNLKEFYNAYISIK